MINDATKYSLGLAGFGVLAAVVYRMGAGDRAGALLLLALAIAASIVALGTGRTIGSDPTPFVAGDAEVASVAIDPADGPASSPMPLLAAVGVVLAVAGGAIGADLVVYGLIVAAVGFAGWLAGSWRTTPTFTRRDAANLDDRLLGPVGLPIVALIVTALIAISFSRVLLAVSATASWVIALIVASVVLAVLWMLANRETSSRLGPALAAAGLVATLVAGGAGASAGEREFHPHEEPEIAVVEIEAKEIKFDKDDFELPADQDAEIVFANLDIGINHNVAVYTAGEPGEPVFNGKPILEGDVVYKLRTPAVGTYRYVCDFHPTMVGKLTVVKSTEKPTKDEDGETGH